MVRQIKCECGYVARGKTDAEMVDPIDGHVCSDHPELVETLTRDEIAGWVEVVALRHRPARAAWQRANRGAEMAISIPLGNNPQLPIETSVAAAA